MVSLTATNLVNAIANLPRNVDYNYANIKNSGKIIIDHIEMPEGPIRLRRYKNNRNEAKVVSIAPSMIWRLANAISEGKPVSLERVYASGGNNRSVLEALVAHTPEFYMCYPKRIENNNAKPKIKDASKHILWLPSSPHKNGVIEWKDVDFVISEISNEVIYGALELPSALNNTSIDIDEARRHAQIQIALVLIGEQLKFRTWVAQNDRSIQYQDKRIAEYPAVVDSLANEKLLHAYNDAVHSALMIDCIWFRNSRFMPAVLEIEHSTGVTSGLTRMKGFYDKIPPLKDVRWTIVAPDKDRQKVLKEANREQFKELNTRFFPYSAVEELFYLCEKRKLTGVNDNFLDCFMEPCVK